MDKPKTPTQTDRSISLEYFDGKIPYGFISKKKIDWIISERTLIGQGTYGKVYRYDTPYGIVVVKLITHEREIKADYIKEITCLRTINHPNVIRLLDVFFTQDEIGIVLPLRSTTLDRIIHDGYLQVSKSRKIDLTPIIIDSIIYQIIQGMIAIQDANILNGDYKLDNVLVFPSDDGKCIRIEISDFGLANVDECFEKPFEWELFIPNYRPPELGLYREHLDEPYNTRPKFPLYTRKADSWVLGCMIYRIFAGKNIFDLIDDEDTSFYRKIGAISPNNIPKGEETNLTILLANWINNKKDEKDIEEEDEVEYENEDDEEEQRQKKLYYNYLDIDIDQEEDNGRDMDLITKIENNVPEKYVNIIYKLLKFYPQQRLDIREVANYPGLFDELKNKETCIVNSQKSNLTQRDDLDAYCFDYLDSSQFPIGNKNLRTANPRSRINIIDICEQLISMIGFETDLGGRTKALTVVLLDTYAERNASEGGTGAITFSHIGGAILVAVAFYGVIIDTEQIVELIVQTDTDTIFTYALQVFASADFRLIRSTSYDLIRIYRNEYKPEVVDTAYWLLQISYMTNIYKVYSHEQICFGIYLISQLSSNQNANMVPRDREVAQYLLNEINSISRYINDTILDRTRRGRVDVKNKWNKLLSLKL